MANDLYFFRKIIYTLRKKYGFDIALYHSTETTDYRLGRKIVSRTKYKIKKAVILPNTIFRDYSYASVLTSLNTNFQVGGLFDSNQRSIVIAKNSLPKGYVISNNDYIVFKNKRYNIAKAIEMEVIDYIQLQVQRVEGEATFEIHEACFRDKLTIDETIE